MADVIEDLSGQVSRTNEQGSYTGPGGSLAAADSWLMVSSFSSEVCRVNAAGGDTSELAADRKPPLPSAILSLPLHVILSQDQAQVRPGLGVFTSSKTAPASSA